MLVKEQILAELKKGVPFNEIRRRYRSQSQIYAAITAYFSWVGKIKEEREKELQNVQGTLIQAKDELEEVRCERENITGEVAELTQDRNDLEKEIQDKTKELHNTTTGLVDLKKRGITEDAVNRIILVEQRSGEALLSDVSTAADCKKIKKAVTTLKREKTRLTRDIQDLKKDKAGAEQELRSTENKLDELLVKVAAHQEAADALFSLIDAGYTQSDILSLISGLETVRIADSPHLSITRLIAGLEKVKALHALENTIIEKRSELETLENNLAKVEGELQGATQLIQTFSKLERAGEKAIDATAKRVENELDGCGKELQQQGQELLATIRLQFQQFTEIAQAKFTELRKLEAEKARIEEVLQNGQTLLAIIKSPETLKGIPLSFIVQLFQRLELWVQVNLPNQFVTPSQGINQKDSNLNPWMAYRLSALVEFTSEALKNIHAQRMQAANFQGSG